MKSEKLLNNIYHVCLDSKLELNSTFLRFQEHYESVEFRGKIFSVDEFKKWYTNNSPNGKRTGKFTYYEDWAGCNLASYVLEPFYDGKFNPLSAKEKKLLDLFPQGQIEDKFYIIGTYKGGKPGTRKHEIAHGLFYCDAEYNKEVLVILGELPQEHRSEVDNYLASFNKFHPDVWVDETHAFIMNELVHMKKAGIDIEKFKEANIELNKIFDKRVSQKIIS